MSNPIFFWVIIGSLTIGIVSFLVFSCLSSIKGEVCALEQELKSLDRKLTKFEITFRKTAER